MATNTNNKQDLKKITEEKRKSLLIDLKGRVAEVLVKKLFECSDYRVFHYGMEHVLTGMESESPKDVPPQIRWMPDFVVQHKTTKEIHFIEVKFRSDEKFQKEDLEKKETEYPKNTYIILVSRKHIQCLTIEELNSGKKITRAQNHYVVNKNVFNLDRELVGVFCEFAAIFFDNVQQIQNR